MFRSDCANAQADLNLRWAYMSEGTFSDAATHASCRSGPLSGITPTISSLGEKKTAVLVNYGFRGSKTRTKKKECNLSTVLCFSIIHFARVCSPINDFINRNKILTTKILKQGYRYHKLRSAFSKLYPRHSVLLNTDVLLNTALR